MRNRGASLTYTIGTLVLLLGFASLVVDLARVRVAKASLQTATDAAALHGATGLNNGSATSKAIAAAAENTVEQTSVALAGSDIEVGRWNASTRVFTPDNASPDAIRVTARRTAARGDAIPLHFGQIFGIGTCDITATATAYGAPGGGFGFVGLDRIDINSNIVTDSYSSASGPYSAGTALTNGSLVTNGPVSLNSSTIRGDLYMRSGQSLSVSSSSYESRINMGSPASCPTPSAGSYASSNDNSRITPSGVRTGSSFNANSTTVTIPAGNYYFNSFTANSATINVTGAATIYVNGSVDLNSVNFSVAGNLPSNLVFKVVANSGATFTVNSVPNFWADIQAPTAAVNFNSANNHFYGRIVGKSLSMNSNTRAHWDEALPAISGASLGTSRKVSLVN